MPMTKRFVRSYLRVNPKRESVNWNPFSEDTGVIRSRHFTLIDRGDGT